MRALLQKKYMRLVILVVLLLIFIFGVKAIIDSRSKPTSTNAKVEQPSGESPAKASMKITKELAFPLIGGDKKDDKFKFIIDTAEIRDDIVIKGQKATAIKGRDFLIISVKLVNDKDKAFQVNTRDYVRLSVNGNKNEWLAPDINNDPVEVQAISTKQTRVGFPINSSDKDFVLQVGEINGNKETIKLTLK